MSVMICGLFLFVSFSLGPDIPGPCVIGGEKRNNTNASSMGVTAF